MLDELDEDVDTTHSRLKATQKKVRGAAAASSVDWQACISTLQLYEPQQTNRPNPLLTKPTR
jgi:hypothetical protein